MLTYAVYKVSGIKAYVLVPYLMYGALDEPFCRGVKRLSALRPSATIKTSLEAGGANSVAWPGMPWTRGDVK